MKLLVLDGNSIINRAFYAIRLLSTKEGLFTNGIFGFINILEKAMNDEKPDGVVVAFDLSAPTFRHEQYDKYKAQRKGMPDELALQMPLLKEILDKMDISRIELAGYEADDLIGTIAAKCETDGVECVILTGDRDDLQLVNEKTVCVLASTSFGRAESKRYTPELIQQEYGFEPANIVDMKALWGDTSDNIPGVRGVGEKTAKDLIKRFGTVEKIYDNIESTEIKESVRKKLVEGRDMAFMSKKLATICKNVPAQINLEDYIIKNPDYEALLALYTKLEFRTLAEKLRVKLEKEEKQNLAQAEIPEIITVGSLFELMGIAGEFKSIYIDFAYDMLCVYDGQKIYSILRENLCDDYENAVSLVFENDAEKTVFDIKSICNALKHYKVLSKNCTFDVLLAGYLLNPSAPGYSLIDLISTYVGTGYEDIPAQRAFALCAMRSAMQKKLDETGMSDLYKNIELPLAMVLFDMENTGFKLDREALLTWGENLKSESNEIAKLIYDLAGEEFNINSPKQLGEILFQKLKIPAGKKTKTGYRTDADTLEGLRLQYPIVELILKYRQISKLSSTYADGFLKVIAPDGRIHTTFKQTVASTGRISSTEPNLQNIPARGEMGREMRRMFIPESSDYVLVDADYSQIELRVLAHIAGDGTMISAFNNHEDIHTFTATQVFGVTEDMITPELRRRAKAVNFGIVYGISAFSLSNDIKVSVREAKMYIDNYFNKYHNIKSYLDKTIEDAKQNGYVTTLFGRRRWLPELRSSNYNIRSFGERAAMNAPIQGTAADIIKIAMIRVHNRLLSEGLKAKLILQVHDELIIETPKNEKDQVKKLLKEEMEHAADLAVLLEADVKEGSNWFEAK